jgi:hypothetical protein
MSARILLFAIAATGLALAAAGPATAQTYPDRRSS